MSVDQAISPEGQEKPLPPDLAQALADFRQNPHDILKAIKLGGLLHDHDMLDMASKVRGLVVHALHSAVAQNAKPSVILYFLVELYRNFVKKIESEEHARACFQSWNEAVASAGRRLKDPNLPLPLHEPSSDRPWRAAFFLQTPAILGHTEALLEMLRHRPRGAPWANEVLVYVLDGDTAKLQKLIAELDARVVALTDGKPLSPDNNIVRLQTLRRSVAEQDVSHLVWVSTPSTADFSLAMRLAPVQVFWTLKFHPFRLPEIDGYITYGAWSEEVRTVHGEDWQVVPFMMSKPAGPVDASMVAQERARLAQHSILFGTLARTEKINSRPFLDAVVRILRENPHAGYLWTGRQRHSGIEAHFRHGGVADRCHFIGWVNTPVYARVIDVFLESFPFGCGLTGIQAVEAGTAFLSFAAPETQYGMHFLRPLAEDGAAATVIRGLLTPTDGTAPLLYPDNADDYVALAGRLARDAEFRRAVGQAGQDYYRRYLTDSKRMGERFFAVLADVKKPEEGRG